jgi:UDP-glucose 4-epimerase
LSRCALVLGGAGFLGSRIAERLAAEMRVIAVDGLFPQTGADAAFLAPVSGVEFIGEPIEKVAGLPALLSRADAIIDCMGWTCHRLALAQPGYDLELNVQSHLSWLTCFRARAGQRLIYLGSRGQYGRPAGTVDENTPMTPVDIQGIHKLAAEHHFRFFAARERVGCVSLRLPNSIGRNQPVSGPDIGLVGGLVRDALLDRSIEVYGTGRRRPVVCAADIAEMVRGLMDAPLEGFQAFNAPAHDLPLEHIAEAIVERAGSGRVKTGEMPEEVKQIDIGDAVFRSDRLAAALPGFRLTPFAAMMDETVGYFRGRKNDLAV